MSREFGRTRITPSRSLMTPPPTGGRLGAWFVGSGKLVIPCACMHPDTLSIAAIAAGEGFVGAPPPGSPPPGTSFSHVFRAAWNTDDRGLMPVIWRPPVALGSGEFSTPCLGL